MPLFLEDLLHGNPKSVYRTDQFADLTLSPVPDFHLLDLKAYASMNIQVTRGCPFACDFCEITTLLGHKVRMKKPHQVIQELEILHRLKWRGSVSIVDDNFIGNKKEIKFHLLPAMKNWMKQHKYPFSFSIQTSVNLADDDDLLQIMRDTGFNSAFIGIESPVEQSLSDCHKIQNQNRDLIQNVKKIQHWGFNVSGGFIVGFDSDAPSIFEHQIDFIQKSGIISAMVGLLNAPRNTRLYNRLKEENRLTVDPTGSNTDFTMNFIPKMNFDDLMEGYKKIIHSIYSVKPYYKRTRQFLLNYKRKKLGQTRFSFSYLVAFLKSMVIIGIINKGRGEYWKFLFWTLFRRPGLIVDAVTYTVYGYHFRMVYGLRNNNRS
jgi:radical SAM superfamily enzyme YgiQ (UPF0313 family)